MGDPLSFDGPKGEPEDKPVKKLKRRRIRSNQYVFPPEPKNKLFTCTIYGCFIGTFVLCVFSLFVSQYDPIFGSSDDQDLAEPWGPVRAALIPAHLFTFGLIGIALGTAVGAGIGFAISVSKDGSQRY